MSLAFLLAWFFETRFTSLLFRDSSQVLKSSYFSLATATTILFGLLFVRPPLKKLLENSNVQIIIGVLMGVFAILSSLPPYIISFSTNDTGYIPYILTGILSGIVIFFSLIWGISIYKRYSLEISWNILIYSSLIAIGLIIISNLLIPIEYGFINALLPINSIIFFIDFINRKEEKDIYNNFPKPLIENSKPILLNLLLFFSSFYVVYMPTMFPKTTNMTIGYFSDSSLGGINIVSLVGLILYLIFLVLLLLFARGNTKTTPYIALFVIVVLAFTFYFLSTMSTSNLVFMIIMPCAIIFEVLACSIFLATFDLKQPYGFNSFRNGFTWIIIGGFFAAVLSTLFLGPLYNAYLFQDLLFVFIVGSVFITIVILLISLHNDLGRLLFPSLVLNEKIDSSFLENRCKLVSNHYKLTSRECEVLSLLVEGRNEPYISEALTVSRATVKTHIKHIYQKIDVSSRQELLDLFYGK